MSGSSPVPVDKPGLLAGPGLHLRVEGVVVGGIFDEQGPFGVHARRHVERPRADGVVVGLVRRSLDDLPEHRSAALPAEAVGHVGIVGGVVPGQGGVGDEPQVGAQTPRRGHEVAGPAAAAPAVAVPHRADRAVDLVSHATAQAVARGRGRRLGLGILVHSGPFGVEGRQR